MMRVRMSNGTVIEYSAANYAVRNHAGGYTDLYTKKDGVWVAQLPTRECILEPNPETRGGRVLPDPVTDLERALNVLEHTDERRRVDAWLLKRLKAALDAVDGRSGRWRR
jgi:hypothetical protein